MRPRKVPLSNLSLISSSVRTDLAFAFDVCASNSLRTGQGTVVPARREAPSTRLPPTVASLPPRIQSTRESLYSRTTYLARPLFCRLPAPRCRPDWGAMCAGIVRVERLVVINDLPKQKKRTLLRHRVRIAFSITRASRQRARPDTSCCGGCNAGQSVVRKKALSVRVDYRGVPTTIIEAPLSLVELLYRSYSMRSRLFVVGLGNRSCQNGEVLTNFQAHIIPTVYLLIFLGP